MDDLVQWLGEQLDEDERLARAATPGPWSRMGQRVLDPTPPSDRLGVGMAVGHAAAHADFNETAEHIAEHDPARVLSEIDAKRQQLADVLAEKHVVVEDCWYTCAAATEERDGGETCNDAQSGKPCDCGRDARVGRRLRLLALPYDGRPGHQESWRP